MARYGLIGRALAHSYSVMIQHMLGVSEYALYEIEPETLGDFVSSCALDGFNVTIPYKQAVVKYLRVLTDTAKRTGSVNTVIRLKSGELAGDNTDYYGFKHLLGDARAYRNKKALILGSGGAARTARAALEDAGARAVIISREGENNYQNIDLHADAELIVNATPAGMYPNNDASPVDLKAFPALKRLIDLIYNPARTRLILQARDMGVETSNGLEMLIAQALRAGEVWGARAPSADARAEIERVARAISKRARNIALLGMPGSGKSSVGARLAALTGRELIDTDDMAARMAGMPVADIINARGEAAFREIETRALKYAAKQSGKIIATGGGIVETAENRAPLMQNSVCVWIQRDIDMLAQNGRPLTRALGVRALYEARAPLYEAWCDMRVQNIDIEATAKRIAEECT